MRERCGKIAVATGMITGSALDGTDLRIVAALTIVTVILVLIAIGGKR